jgi:cytochrome P450
MRPVVEKTVSDLIDRLAVFPSGDAVDLKKEFSYRLPLQIICDLFGIPMEGPDEGLRDGEKNSRPSTRTAPTFPTPSWRARCS